MVAVTAHHDDVVFTVRGLHKVFAFKSQLTVPRSHIAEVRPDPEMAKTIRGFRQLGTSGAWLLKAGTFYLRGQPGLKPAFVDVAGPQNVVVVTLRDEKYQQLIIEVDDPVTVVALLATSR